MRGCVQGQSHQEHVLTTIFPIIFDSHRAQSRPQRDPYQTGVFPILDA